MTPRPTPDQALEIREAFARHPSNRPDLIDYLAADYLVVAVCECGAVQTARSTPIGTVTFGPCCSLAMTIMVPELSNGMCHPSTAALLAAAHECVPTPAAPPSPAPRATPTPARRPIPG